MGAAAITRSREAAGCCQRRTLPRVCERYRNQEVGGWSPPRSTTLNNSAAPRARRLDLSMSCPLFRRLRPDSPPGRGTPPWAGGRRFKAGRPDHTH